MVAFGVNKRGVGLMLWRLVRVRIGHDRGDEVADLLDFGFASVGNEIAGERLRGEERGARDTDFRLGRGPFAAVERFHRELDDELVRRNAAVFGLLFDMIPLRGRHPDVLLQRLCHSLFRSFGADFRDCRARDSAENFVFSDMNSPETVGLSR